MALTGSAEGPGPSPGLTAAVLSASTQRHGIPALLSFFVPGLGQLVKGDFLGGILMFVAAGISALLCFAGIGLVLLPVTWIFGIYNAYVEPDAAAKQLMKRGR